MDIPDAVSFASIDCFYEDSRGFMWMGTYSGLYMYDGSNFTHFKNNPNDPLSISDNKIRRILEDDKGNFWVGTQNGLNYFDIRKRTFKRFNDKEKFGIGIVGINEIKKDDNKNIWVSTDDGLYWIDFEYQKFNKYDLKFDNIAVGGLLFNKTGFYAISDSGLFFKDSKVGSLSLIPLPKSKELQRDLRASRILKDEYDIIWIGTSKGLFYINSLQNNIFLIEYPLFKNESIRFLVKKSKDELWINTDTGLNILNTITSKFQKYAYNPLLPQGYPQENLFNIFYSSSNILWTQIIGKDVYTVNIEKHRFQSVPIPLMDYIPTVSSLFEQFEYKPDTLFIRQKNGTGLLNIKTGKITPFDYKPDYNLEGWQGGVICFLEEDNNKLWIGTFGGLFLFDKMTKRFINLEEQFKGIDIFRKKTIRKIYRDKKGFLWIATCGNGFFKVNFETRTIKSYYQTKEDNINLLSNTRSILETKNGQIWVGTRGGLCKYMPEADTFKIYKNVLNDPQSMSENTAFCIYEDEKENIWVGTYGGGLNKLDVKTEKFKHYITDNGLVDNNVISIFPDMQGNLWLTTFSGISSFNPQTELFRNYRAAQGLLNNAYSAFLNGKSHYSNLLFFGGDKGIDFFDPNTIHPSTLDPNIFITDFKLFNKSIPISRGEKNSKEYPLSIDISFTKHLELAYEQNVIGFEFAALDFSAPKNIQYAYMLEGFDTAWQYIGHTRSATFTNLNPGNYTFKVKATNADGVWGTKTASIKLTVLAPWWQTWWFRTLVVLTLFGLGFAFYQYRISQIKEREAIKTALNQRISEVEMEALRSQMSPHFIFNCLSAITRFILNYENEAAILYLTKFSRLVRLVLNHSQMDTIPLYKELEAIHLYLDMEELRFHEKFMYNLNIDDTLATKKIYVPPMLIQPYLENAVWHGLLPKKSADNQLLVDIKNGGDTLTITIEDNGIGRDKAAELKSKTALSEEHKSYGMKLTEERFQIINKTNEKTASVSIIDLKNKEGQALGTRVVLLIPITFDNK